MEELTDKQKHCLEIIIKMKQNKGFSPTFREIANELGITQSGVLGYIRALVKKGYIHCSSYLSRSIVVLKLPEKNK